MHEFALFFQSHWVSIVGTLAGLLYLFLEYKASIWMWAASIAMAAFYIYIFYFTQLYANMGIYAYFLLASVYGWIIWLKKGRSDNGEYTIRSLDKKYVPRVIVAILFVAIVIFIILYYFTENSICLKAGDAVSTALNIIALFLISYRFAEQWLLLIPANFISAVLLFIQGDTVSGCLFVIFCMVSVMGFKKWMHMASENKQN